MASPQVFPGHPSSTLNIDPSNGLPKAEGWLTKQGNYIRNWRLRWFQLQNGVLYYYKEPTSEIRPTNYFLLEGSRTLPCPRFGANAFELVLMNGQRRYMQAANKSERDEWIEALRASSIPRRGLVPPGTGTPASNSTNRVSPSGGPRKGSPGDVGAALSNESIKLAPEDFNFTKVLGKGNYGKVMLSTLRAEGVTKMKRLISNKDEQPNEHTLYAVKVIKKSGLLEPDNSVEQVLAENRVLQGIRHPFLVQLVFAFQTPDRLFFVLEYIRGGELFFHMSRERRFSESRSKLYLAEITLALTYLHERDIVYRDLKLENLLLDDEGHIKLTDFGLCKEGVGAGDTTSTFCGTPEYLAPEILEDETYGKAVDWWALGVVGYEMMAGRPPFGSPSDVDQLFQAILTQDITFPHALLSSEAKSLIRGLMNRDHTKRLGGGPRDGHEVMEHQFFESLDFDDVYNRRIQMPFKPDLRGDMDTQNFDREFTAMPAVLTPSANNVMAQKAAQIKLENFTYVGGSALGDADDQDL